MNFQSISSGRWAATSTIHRDVIHAQGHTGSQKNSTSAMWGRLPGVTATQTRRAVPRRSGHTGQSVRRRRAEGRVRVLVHLSDGGRPRIVADMAFSPFDKRLLDEGLAFFSRPRLAGLLEELGATEGERVDALATMLRNAAPDEFDEAVAVFERAVARVTREQERARD